MIKVTEKRCVSSLPLATDFLQEENNIPHFDFFIPNTYTMFLGNNIINGNVLLNSRA